MLNVMFFGRVVVYLGLQISSEKNKSRMSSGFYFEIYAS
jgi:hypothetical protein